MSLSLDQYAAEHAHRIGGKASCCRLIPPEYMAEIEGFIADGSRPWQLIHDWLAANGVEGVSKHMIAYHFVHGHHKR